MALPARQLPTWQRGTHSEGPAGPVRRSGLDKVIQMLFSQSRVSPLLCGHRESKAKAHTKERTSPGLRTGNTEVMCSDRVDLKGEQAP